MNHGISKPLRWQIEPFVPKSRNNEECKKKPQKKPTYLPSPAVLCGKSTDYLLSTRRALHKKRKTNRYIFVCTKVILASGYYAAFRVTLVAKELEGTYDGAIHITTDYEVSTSQICLSGKGSCNQHSA